MAAPNILERYIVGLSMKGPSAAEQREAEKAFSALAEAVAVIVPTITAAATAIVFATDKIAGGLSKLYFESQKTGATVREIAALGYAFEQNGSTLEKFHADFDKFSQTLRDFPSYKKQLRDKLGLKPEDFKDDLATYEATLKALAAKRAAGDTQSEGAWRTLFGFDEDNIIARGRKEFDKFYKEGFERNKGIDENSVKALALVRSLNAFGAALDAVGRKAAAALFDKYGIVLDDITKWVDDHSDEIIDDLKEVVDQFVLAWKDIEPVAVPAVHKIAAGLDTVTIALDRILGSPDGQHGGLHAVRYVLDALAIYIAGKWALRLLALLGLRGIGGAALGALGIGGAAVAGAGGAAGAGAYEFFEHVPKAEGDDSYGLDHPGWHPGMPKEQTRHQKESAAPSTPMPEQRTQEYIKNGGAGPFSHDQNVGGGQDFNIPGQGGFHPIAGKVSDFTDFTSRKALLGGKHPTHGELDRTWDKPENQTNKAVEPGLDYDPDKLRGHGGIVDPGMWNKKQFHDFINYPNEIHKTIASISSPRANHNQWSRTNNIGTRKQTTNIQLASTDPHTAASEIARHMKAIHAGTLHSLDRLA